MLALYPTAFRLEYEEKLILLFQDQLRDAKARKTVGAMVRFWIRMLVDTGYSASRERWSDLRRVVGSGSPAVLLLHVFPTPRRGFSVVLFLVITSFVARWWVGGPSYEAVTFIAIEDGSRPDSDSIQIRMRELCDDKTLEAVVRSVRAGLPAMTMRSEVARIRNSMTVGPIRNTALVEVRYAAFRAVEAAAMANRIADAFLVRRLGETGHHTLAIIDRATPPLRPARGDLKRSVVGGTVFGALAGGALALVVVVLKRSASRGNVA